MMMSDRGEYSKRKRSNEVIYQYFVHKHAAIRLPLLHMFPHFGFYSLVQIKKKSLTDILIKKIN